MKKFLFALCLLSFALPAAAALAEPVKIGILGPTAPSVLIRTGDAIAAQLMQGGLARDRDFTFELRGADGKVERLPGFAKELVDARVTVIVTRSYPAARAAKDATSTIPIVSMTAGEPVETGLAMSLAQPGGNVTGLSDMSSQLSLKRLELLRLAVPGMKRVALLWNADDVGMTGRYRAASAGAAGMGVAVQALGVREPDDFNVAFAAMDKEMPDGILMVTDVLTALNRKRVFEYATAHHLPAIYEADNFARDGGLMSYGPDEKEILARVGDLVGRILKGAKPADLPFEQPTRFLFVVNRKTADADHIELPGSLLERADEVIE